MNHINSRQIIIGDVHGHYRGLMKLLEAIAPGESDKVYFLGDLIDRGPESCEVIEFVKESRYTSVRGNHEQMLLDIVSGQNTPPQIVQKWLYSGGQATIDSYKNSCIPEEHIHWLQSLPNYIDLGDTWLVHAGIHPNIPFLQQNSNQFCWVRDEFLSIKQPYFSDKQIIIGHTIAFTLPNVEPGQLAQGQGWIDIDTGAYHPYSGWLTGLDIKNNLVYQFNVITNLSRIRPLKEAVTVVEPEHFDKHQFGKKITARNDNSNVVKKSQDNKQPPKRRFKLFF
ncbi:MAG: metallophosphoesterase family protein [Mastigocoleus sp.]